MSARNSLKNKALRRAERERKDAERQKQQLAVRVQSASMISDYLKTLDTEEE